MTDRGVAIHLQEVRKVFEAESARVAALEGTDLQVRRGGFVSVIGPSGCGKTTLLRIVGDLESPTSGVVLVDGRPPPEARRIVFLIDKSGTIRKVYQNVTPDEHATEILRDAEQLGIA